MSIVQDTVDKAAAEKYYRIYNLVFFPDVTRTELTDEDIVNKIIEIAQEPA